MALRRLSALLVAGTAALATLVVASPLTRAQTPTTTALAGTFSLTAGLCPVTTAYPASPPGGSYFFMTQGLLGIPVPNISSGCGGGDYTPLAQGSQGLVTGGYQLDPNPSFDSGGNSQANAIIQPAALVNTNFGLATTCADQQHAPTPTGSCPGGNAAFPVPTLNAEAPATGGCLPSATTLPSIQSLGGLYCIFGDLRAIGATWNATGSNCATTIGIGCYDQGAAVADDLKTVTCTGGGGCSLSGTYNPLTNAYILDWSSTINGGAFNGFIGHYHFEGTFTPGGPAANASPGSPSSAQSTPTPSATPAPSGPSGPGTSKLQGVLQIAAGQCGAGTPSGSYFAMTKGGGPVKNNSPNCGDGAYTLLTQGGTGLTLDNFQPPPGQAFDANGNALAGDIVKPVPFFGTNFSLATDAKDEQNSPSGADQFSAPSAVLNGSTLTADLNSLVATWNGTPNKSCADGNPPGTGCYQQGASSATGTYDPSSQHYSLSWSATIHGGAFNGATGNWHLEGTFSGHVVQVAARSVPGLPGTGTPPDGTWPWAAVLVASLALIVAGAGTALARRSRRGRGTVGRIW
ncbi:MAG: hypothetical protein JOZ75_10520 [Candidatus Dormibacteraeota bacterium]|nr:hypothetical protein [Candidatus Dormibacteraeota bacterium]